jgi:hypothetical protein
MSAGYVQLAAIGQQDVYLTGEPEVTYFSGVYRRHTPFVLEAYEIPFLEQEVRYGDNNICRIPPKGDLVRGLTLKMTLPALRQSGAGGGDWYWPTIPSSSNAAQLVINGTTPVIGPFVGIDYYSTFNLADWLNGTGTQGKFKDYVTYDRIVYKFGFSGCSNVWVIDVNQSSPNNTNIGVFWGLDPKAATTTGRIGGQNYLVYSVPASGRTADFNLEQAGWLRNPSSGMPDPPTRSGAFLQTNQSAPLGGYLNFAGSGSTGKFWTHSDSDASFSVTPGGRISFAASGLYIMRVGFGLDTGSVSNVAWGLSSSDGEPIPPDFQYTYPWRVSPNPSSPAILPMNITSAGSNVYVYASGTGSTLRTGSYVAINPADDLYVLKSDVSLYQSNVIPFFSNIVSTGSAITSLLPDAADGFAFKINKQGSFVVTGVLAMSAGYVSSVTVSDPASATAVYMYDMSSQGRDPTFAFSMPIVVTDVNRKYRINVASTSTTAKVLSNSYFVFNQVAVPAATGTPSVVLPFNGLMFGAGTTGQFPVDPLRLSTDFTLNGYQYIETLVSNAISFSNVGTYMLTGAICTDVQIRSLSINVQGTVTTYPVGLGLSPPYTVSIPFRVSNILASSTTFSIVTASGGLPTMNASTFLAVYPIASNANPVNSYQYYDSVATRAIQTAELKMGGQLIETLTGEVIELWNDLRISSENQPGLTLLTGKGDSSQAYSARSYYVNLPFYFYESPELSLPIVATSRQDLEVHITFRPFSELTAVTSVQNPPLVATIITEYVYLSEPEINWFRSNRIEHIITQYQYQTFTLPPNFTTGVFKLEFKNPIREMFLVIQPNGNLSYDYTGNGFRDLTLKFNSQAALTADATQLGTLEPFRKYQTFPTRDFYMYSFGSNPNSPRPTGHVNFSRMNEVLLTVNTDPYFLARQMRLLVVNYNILRVENGLAGLMFN